MNEHLKGICILRAGKLEEMFARNSGHVLFFLKSSYTIELTGIMKY